MFKSIVTAVKDKNGCFETIHTKPGLGRENTEGFSGDLALQVKQEEYLGHSQAKNVLWEGEQ